MTEALDVSVAPEAGGKVSVAIRNGALAFSDRCDAASATSRTRLRKLVETKFPDVNGDELESLILKALDEPPRTAKRDAEDPSAPGDQALAEMEEDVVAEARAMLESPDLLAEVVGDIASLGITGEETLALTCYLIGTSRLLSKPLAGIVQGSSSSGKSHVVERVADLFASEAKILVTDITANALYYMPRGALRHRFVVAGERSRGEDDDRAEATRALREMISSGVLRKMLPEKRGDVNETVVIECPGPIGYIETTTLPELFEEDSNRALLLATDDSEQQTRRVVNAITASYARPRDAQDAERIVAKHHAAQRMLRRCKVAIPFAERIGEHMPTERPDARRAIHAALGVVQAVTLLHQRQRGTPTEHGTEIVATIDDYVIARGLVAGPLARALGRGLPEHVTSFLDWLRRQVSGASTFTVPELPPKPGCRWSQPTCYRLCAALRGVGILADAGRDGQRTRYRLTGRTADDASTWLPIAEDLA